MLAKVLITPKEGILDPQGKAVERALPTLGFKSVGNVRVGRLVEVEYEDREELERLCEKLLVNPLVEDYEITAGASSLGSASDSAGAEPSTPPSGGPRLPSNTGSRGSVE